MYSRKYRRLVIPVCLFFIALALELIYIKSYSVKFFISPDGLTYSNIAENFLQGNGLVNTANFAEGADHSVKELPLSREYVVGPVYPLLLALVYGIFGFKNYGMVVVCQALLSAGSAVIAYKTGELLFGKKYAWIPFVLTLGYPLFASWGMYVLTETAYVFTIELFLYFLALYSKQVKRSQFKTIVLLGVVIGVSNLVRPLLLLFFPVLGVWIFWLQRWRLKTALRDFGLVVLVTILVMSPWWIRNGIKYHQFVTVSNYGSYEFYLGNNPLTITDIYFTFDQLSFDPEVKARIEKQPVLEQEKEYKQLAVAYIVRHPVEFLGRTLAKEINLFWRPVALPEAQDYKMIGYRLDKWYLCLGLAGAVLCLFRLKKYSFLLLFTVYYSFVVSMIAVVSGARYRLPLMPAMILFVSIVAVIVLGGMEKLIKSLAQKDRRANLIKY